MMILLFSLPQGLSDGKKAAISIGIYALYSILYALMNVPYSTMLSVLSSDYNQRISFNLFKNVGANLGAVFVTATTLTFVSFFSKAGGNGFSKTAILFAVVFLIEILMCVVNTKERVTTQNDSFSWKESVSAALKNRPWLILCGVQFLTLTSYVTRNQSTLYYAKYYLENETASSLMLTLNSVTAVGMSVILPSIVKKTGMKRCVITGNLIWSLAMLATWMVGKNMVPVIILHTIAAIGFSMATGMVFVMLSQTIDYAQQTTGIRPQGMFTSVLAFVQKMGVACAGLICSQVLAMGNYVANQESNSSAILAIRILFCGLPMILCICTMFLMSMYHLKEDRK
jgi:sugar (glycoside-pentoside-hexuronide) transporter